MMEDFDRTSSSNSSCETMLKEFASFPAFACEHGLAMSSFQYDNDSFGDWEVQVGTAYRRFKLNWYGRDGQLLVMTKLLRQPKGSPIGWRPQWEEVARVTNDC
jgi:hypothetical protein